MFKITLSRKNFLVLILITLLALAALPLANVYAASPQDDPQPTEEQDYARLRMTFQHLKLRVESQRIFLEHCSLLAEEAQGLIDFAAEKGLDASNVQAALDEMLAVLPDAKASHAEAVTIVNSHNGFDANGNVIDPVAARETTRTLRTTLRTTIATLDGTPKALLDAMRNFAEQNRGAFRPAEHPQGSLQP